MDAQQSAFPAYADAGGETQFGAYADIGAESAFSGEYFVDAAALDDWDPVLAKLNDVLSTMEEAAMEPETQEDEDPDEWIQQTSRIEKRITELTARLDIKKDLCKLALDKQARGETLERQQQQEEDGEDEEEEEDDEDEEWPDEVGDAVMDGQQQVLRALPAVEGDAARQEPQPAHAFAALRDSGMKPDISQMSPDVQRAIQAQQAMQAAQKQAHSQQALAMQRKEEEQKALEAQQAMQQQQVMEVKAQRAKQIESALENTASAASQMLLLQQQAVQQKEAQAQLLAVFKRQLEGPTEEERPKHYKKTPCKFWEQGMCSRGAECTFSHGEEDGGGLLPNMGLVPPQPTPLMMPPFGLDPNMPTGPLPGALPPGPLAGAMPTGPLAGPLPTGPLPAGPLAAGTLPGPLPGPPGLLPTPGPPEPEGKETWYKLALCKYFPEGMCSRGEYCTFAHGEHELGQPMKNWEDKEKAAVDSIPQKPAPGNATGPLAFPVALPGAAMANSAIDAEWGGLEVDAAVAAMAMPMPPPGLLNAAAAAAAMPLPVPPPPDVVANVSVNVASNAAANLSAMAASCSPGVMAWFGEGSVVARNDAQKLLEAFKASSTEDDRASWGADNPATPWYKTQICKFYQQGKCSRGSRCSYAHGDVDMRTYGGALDQAKERGLR